MERPSKSLFNCLKVLTVIKFWTCRLTGKWAIQKLIRQAAEVLKWFCARRFNDTRISCLLKNNKRGTDALAS